MSNENMTMHDKINNYCNTLPGVRRVLRNLHLKDFRTDDLFVVDFLVFFEKGAFIVLNEKEDFRTPASVAVFNLSKGEFPVVSFCYSEKYSGTGFFKDSVQNLNKMVKELFDSKENMPMDIFYQNFQMLSQYDEEHYADTYEAIENGTFMIHNKSIVDDPESQNSQRETLSMEEYLRKEEEENKSLVVDLSDEDDDDDEDF